MTSPPPLLYDAFYHIYNRGNNRENIFIEERNYRHFLHLYQQHIQPIADTYAYCLLKNHFHLLVKIKTEAEIALAADAKGSTEKMTSGYPSRMFSNFFNAYAKSMNLAYGRVGALFQHPFGRKLIADNSHLAAAVIYIHHNPQKHGFVSDYRDWRFSSFRELTGDGETIIQRSEVLGMFGGEKTFLSIHGLPADTASIEWMSESED